MKSVDETMAELDAAVETRKQREAREALMEGVGGGKGGGDTSARSTPQAEDNGLVRWMKNLPQNIGVGLIDAAVNTYDVAPDVLPGASATTFAAGKAKEEAKANLTPHQRRMGAAEALEADPLREAVLGFRNELASGSKTSDVITQGAAQFMIPFMGWSKAFNIFKAATTAGKVAGAAAAESATMATAFDPHGGRLADLVAFGKQTEGKLADTLNAITPDGSALNAYIDYMSSREDEGEAEGRFKNVVDGLAGSVAVAGLLKVGAVTFKTARMGLENVVPSGSGSGIPNQEGMVAFHGTAQESIERFDISKVGTGQGAQTFGHGLYFAENPKTAGHYREMLSRRESFPAMDEARLAVKEAGGDRLKAATTLDSKAASATDELDADQFRQAAEIARSGDIRERGAVYKVDIPDEQIEQMIDWDVPMSKQQHVLKKIPRNVRDRLEQMLEEAGYVPELEEFSGNQFYQLVGKGIQDDVVFFNPKDGDFTNAKKLASEYLSSLDVPGIRYLDQGSRASGEGTRNLVLFDDKFVKIIKKE